MDDSVAPRIFVRLNDKRVEYLPNRPAIAGGQGCGYVFERQQLAAGQIPPHLFEEHIFMLPLGADAVPFHSRLNGHAVDGLIEPGGFRFAAAGDSLSTSWEAPLDAIFVTLHPDVMRSALGEETYGPNVELISNIVAHDDPLLKYLTFAMQEYLATDRLAGKIFERSLLGAIAAHLLKTCASGKRGASRGMPLPRWKRLRVERYIRERLALDLSLDDIAMSVGMRPHQLSRAFRASTGQSVWQFVLETRAREATRLMARHPSMPLADVAFACGFESYPQFIAAFRKFFGQLPSEHRHTRMT